MGASGGAAQSPWCWPAEPLLPLPTTPLPPTVAAPPPVHSVVTWSVKLTLRPGKRQGGSPAVSTRAGGQENQPQHQRSALHESLGAPHILPEFPGIASRGQGPYGEAP